MRLEETCERRYTLSFLCATPFAPRNPSRASRLMLLLHCNTPKLYALFALNTPFVLYTLYIWYYFYTLY
jgi:hypothetical protein